ncbi:MAG: GNAT family N-acetyltransferase [Chthoniobacterales bacterium]
MRLELENCTVRSWRLEDARALVKGANNRNVWLCLRDRMPHPYTLGDAGEYLRRATTAEPPESFCIEVNKTVAGAIGLHRKTDVHRRTAELGYWLAEPFWGRGIGTAVVRAFVAHSFETLPLDRIFAEVYANNPASARVLEKADFQFEGRLRKNVIKAGQVLDSLLYARLRALEEIAPGAHSLGKAIEQLRSAGK